MEAILSRLVCHFREIPSRKWREHRATVHVSCNKDGPSYVIQIGETGVHCVWSTSRRGWLRYSRAKSFVFCALCGMQLFDRDEAEAEDIVSEVAFNLLRRADVIGEIENLTAYFYRALANRVVDHRRAQVPTVRIDDQERESAPVEIPDDRLGPEQTLQQERITGSPFQGNQPACSERKSRMACH